MRKKNFFSPLAAAGVAPFLFCLLFSTPVYADKENMTRIPTGKFQMGSDKGGDDEKPVRTIHVDAFYMDIYEVVQEDFEDVMNNNPSRYKEDLKPVENVTWFEADEYCKKVGKRLPSEAEWEYAARGGTQTTYYWGDEMDASFTWYEGNSGVPVLAVGDKHVKVVPLHIGRAGGSAHPVGTKRENIFGLYDMIGNVWEWVDDWYHLKYYKLSKRTKNPRGPKKGELKSLRGGSWYTGALMTRIANRASEKPTKRSDDLGFRCVVSIPVKS